MDTARKFMAKRLKELRKCSGMSVDDVGSAIGKSGKTVSAWEVGRGQPDADVLVQLCRLYGAEIGDFYNAEAYKPTPTDCYRPFVGSIAAGTPLEAIEIGDERSWCSPSVAEKYPNSFFLRVNGDSMNLRYQDGTLVLIDPDQRDIESGRIYAVLVNGHDATLKQVFVAGDTIVLHPLSTNPEHRDRSIDATDPDAPYFAVVGRVVWFVGFEE